MQSTSEANGYATGALGAAAVGSRSLRVLPGFIVLACALLSVFAIQLRASENPAKLDFNFQVRPILADRCFKCHGPDEKARKAKMRLDLRENALAVRDPETGVRAIVPGHPENSELYSRITATNEDDRMPPLSSNLTLSDAEKELLKRWIEEGAEYKQHWAFLPLVDKAVPASKETKNPIDAFVIERLHREGLNPSLEASREMLIRRLSFDLRGLPPTLAEIDEFLADRSPGAYEKVVDRFLASPAYGEKQANEWLDLARYADTYGYQNDVERDLSPWRDWVIRAFNSNLPYDRFITWQLAGDLMPGTNRDRVLATAFNRLHRQTNEGGSIDDEFRAEYVADRVATAGTAFLGLTVGCAKCHDHKYDPIKQKDFYRMAAFFNNIDESGLYSHFTHAMPSPTLLLYREGEEQKHQALARQIAEKQTDLAQMARAAAPKFAEWTNSNKGRLPEAVPTALFSFEQITTNGSPDVMSTNHFAQLVDSPQQAEGKIGKGMKFSGDNSVECKGIGVFDRTSPFTFTLWLKPTEKQDRAVIFHRSRAWSDSGSRGYELVLEDGKPAFGLIHFWPGNAIKVQAKTGLPLNEWSHLAVSYDGSSRAAGIRLYLNGRPVAVEIVRDNLYKDILHREQWGDFDSGAIDLTLAGRFRDSGFKNGVIDEFTVFDHVLTGWEIERSAGAKVDEADPASLYAWFLQHSLPDHEAASTELRGLRQQENALLNDVPEIMVMSEMATRRPTHLLKRGAYDTPAEVVEPGVPDSIFAFKKDLPANRLGLAQWVVDPQNPLTARVAVNRAWRMHFGRGLVVTEEDFGTQGKLPTHPELLDWMARHFIQTGWDLKALHKTMVMSSTYRQTSKAGPELLARDPDNVLLARGPNHRLRAEEIRDNALAVSGLLVQRLGGASVRPYQPEGLWEEAGTGKHYTQDKGEGLYRRSLYTFWRRTAPPPTMLIFDAPTREFCLARRETTTTPLQSLVLLDDPQYLEAARVLAEKLVREHREDVDAGIVDGFRVATGRAPKPAESDSLRRLYREQLEVFEANPKAAEQYLKIGERTADASVPSPQLAAMSVVASTMMNLDEFVMKR